VDSDYILEINPLKLVLKSARIEMPVTIKNYVVKLLNPSNYPQNFNKNFVVTLNINISYFLALIVYLKNKIH